MKTVVRLMGSVLVLAAAVLPAGQPAAVAAPGGAESTYHPLILVIDASGSMSEPDAGDGQTRMAAAQQAATNFVDMLPTEAEVGLATYGTGTGPSSADRAAGCRDYHQLTPVGTPDRAAMKAAIEGLRPRGYTPIGVALRNAAAALPREGGRSIVLVSDGEDTCAPPPPCEIAAELARDGVDLRIHTVGFKTGGDARDQLACIARSTGGTYSDADDGAALKSVLPRVASKALRSYRPSGVPVAGAANPAAAPQLGAGSYLDSLGEEAKYYAVDVPASGRIYVSGTVIYPRGHKSSVEVVHVQSFGPDNTECLAARTSEVVTGANEGAIGTVLAVLPVGGCTKAGRHVVAVSRPPAQSQTHADIVTLPVELQVFVEPPLVGDKGPADATSTVPFTAQTGDAVAVIGGGSFADATELPGTGRYTDTLQARERVFFKVKLEFGQGLSYRLTGGPSSGVSSLEAAVYSATRLRWSREHAVVTDGETKSTDPIGTPPIRYNNRNGYGQQHQVMSVPGWYYVSAALSPGYGHKSGTQTPVTLEVNVVGNPIDEPSYSGEVGAAHAVPSGQSVIRTESGSDRSTWIIGGVVAVLAFTVTTITVLVLLLVRHRRR
ncbi:VWA domain-containing protein [Nocardia sp. NPDC052566]|uniref:vWA domain-containing protein n=1 Tax=Nocardia sp. NPDC052566 TaxID=3364330 RepID=UPI0037C7171D